MIWTTNRIVALVLGAVFLLAGIAGFALYGGGSGSLLGLDVDAIHSTIHLVTGIVALAAAFTGWSRLFNQIFGIVYLLVAIIGFIPGLNNINGLYMGMMHVNAADNIFHLVVGLVAAGVGFLVPEHRNVTPRSAA